MEVLEVFKAPKAARQVKVELCLRWLNTGRVSWRHVSLKPVPAPKPRKVRLATIHFQPRAGKSMMRNVSFLLRSLRTLHSARPIS